MIEIMYVLYMYLYFTHYIDLFFIHFSIYSYTNRWYHHVDSKNGRNLAINIWLHHLTKFNDSNCNNTGFDESKFVSVSQFRKERKVTDFRSECDVDVHYLTKQHPHPHPSHPIYSNDLSALLYRLEIFFWENLRI